MLEVTIKNYILTLHNNRLTMVNKTSPTEITPTYAKQILHVCKLHLQQHKIYASNVHDLTQNWDQKKGLNFYINITLLLHYFIIPSFTSWPMYKFSNFLLHVLLTTKVKKWRLPRIKLNINCPSHFNSIHYVHTRHVVRAVWTSKNKNNSSDLFTPYIAISFKLVVLARTNE